MPRKETIPAGGSDDHAADEQGNARPLHVNLQQHGRETTVTRTCTRGDECIEQDPAYQVRRAADGIGERLVEDAGSRSINSDQAVLEAMPERATPA